MDYKHKPTGKIATLIEGTEINEGGPFYSIKGETALLPEWVLQCACEWEKVVDYTKVSITIQEALDLYKALFGDVALVRAFPKKLIELAKTKVK